jgi:stage II sporulation protein D
LAAPAGGTASDPPTFETAAWQLIELPSGRPLQSARPDILQRPAPPGSIVKLATLIAALESGTIRPSTRIPCSGVSQSAAGRVTCVHPRVGRPLGPAEALAYSCNVYFAAVGERLSRARLDGVLASLGLPPTPPSVPMSLAATGVEGASAPPVAWLRALQQVLADPPGVPMHSPTRAVVREGLRGATLYGTAAAFAAHGIEALAKTGTAVTAGGQQQGAVVAAWPAGRPARAAIVLVPGGTGADAAAVAARLASGKQPAAGGPVTRSASMPDRPSAAAATPAAPPSSIVVPAERAIRVGTPATNGSFTVRTYPLEEYVSRVLAGEAAPRSAPAALEALAITARTFALANGRRHARSGFDLCDLTHCQVLREPYPAVRAAAAATAGQVLVWRGAPASVYYTASCGGQTERPSSVWRGADDPPYLPRRADSGCRGEPRWTADIDARDLERALRAAGWRGDRLRDLRVQARTGSGRVGVLSLRGMTPAEISGQDFRMAVGRALGWQLVKSTDFTLSRTAGGYRFSGRGFGHGVGFCVIGAARRAGGGESRASLLQTYFPGTAVAAFDALAPTATEKPRRAALNDPPALASGEAAAVDAPPSKPITTVALRLPDGDAGARASIQALLDSTVARVARRLGTRPTPVEVVFHPSVESFRRVTGEPWWSVARTVGRRIDVQPLNVLRRRGMLERTLAHEIGHVLAEPRLQGRPAWVREGAAMFGAGLIAEADVTAAPGARRPRCPSDDDLRAAVSAAAAGQAYEDARACFARALADGTAWHEVR